MDKLKTAFSCCQNVKVIFLRRRREQRTLSSMGQCSCSLCCQMYRSRWHIKVLLDPRRKHRTILNGTNLVHEKTQVKVIQIHNWKGPSVESCCNGAAQWQYMAVKTCIQPEISNEKATNYMQFKKCRSGHNEENQCKS